MKLFVIVILIATVLAIAQADLGDSEWDCDNIDQAAKEYVDKQIAKNKVYVIGASYCRWCTKVKDYIKRIGFKKGDIVAEDIDETVNGRPDKMAILNYSYCKLSKIDTVPQVFINKKFIGGFLDTRHEYYTGAASKLAYQIGSISSYAWYRWHLRKAARDFVDEGVKRSENEKYFMLSKTLCTHCFAAKKCLKAIGIEAPDDKIELFEINDFETHDEIKLYKKKLTGSPYTPLLAYNGKVLKNHDELVEAAKCPV